MRDAAEQQRTMMPPFRHIVRLAAVAWTMAMLVGSPALAQQRAKPLKRPKLELQRDSNDWRAYQLSGVELMDVKPKQAREFFEWAARLDPARPEPLFGIGVLTNRDEPMRLALERDPFMHYGRIRTFRLEGGNAREMFGLRNVGWFDLASRQLDSARVHFQLALQRWPDDRSLLWGLILAYRDAGLLDSAELAIARQREALHAELTAKNSLSVHSLAFFDYMIGRAYASAKRTAEARSAYERALAEDLSYHPAHVGLALAALAEGDTAMALQEWAMALDLAPAEASYRVAYAALLFDLGRHAEAAEHAAEAVAAAPYYSAARWLLARALDARGERTAAIAAYREYIARAPQVDGAGVATARSRLTALGPE